MTSKYFFTRQRAGRSQLSRPWRLPSDRQSKRLVAAIFLARRVCFKFTSGMKTPLAIRENIYTKHGSLVCYHIAWRLHNVQRYATRTDNVSRLGDWATSDTIVRTHCTATMEKYPPWRVLNIEKPGRIQVCCKQSHLPDTVLENVGPYGHAVPMQKSQTWNIRRIGFYLRLLLFLSRYPISVQTRWKRAVLCVGLSKCPHSMQNKTYRV